MGRYIAAWTATLPGAAVQVSASHNIGCKPTQASFQIECTTADANYSIGDRVHEPLTNYGSYAYQPSKVIGANTVSITTGSTNGILLSNKTTGVVAAPTAASWKYRFTANRGW